MKTLTYTEVKDLIKLTDRKTVKAYIKEENNYNNTYKILSEEDALEEIKNMFKGDYCILGSFKAGFIADFISLDCEDIKTMQEGEHFEIIGKLIMNSGNFDYMMEEYVRLDGWGGPALCSYDGNYKKYKDLIIIRQN
jgi:hypothetical protein